jgi:hypothetical protein
MKDEHQAKLKGVHICEAKVKNKIHKVTSLLTLGKSPKFQVPTPLISFNMDFVGFNLTSIINNKLLSLDRSK